MSNLKELITPLVPNLKFEESALVTVVVPSNELRTLAKELISNQELLFDYLTSLTGMDWGDSLGVVYHLYSNVKRQRLVIKTATTDRENPELPSVSDIWATANVNEREVYDFFGIRFVGHPDMRRLFLRNDWKGFPFRKDYDASHEANPVNFENEETIDVTTSIEELANKASKSTETVLFGDEEYVVNIGPQHPATHGVLRFRVSLEGEFVKKVDLNCGYIHRGIEKMCEELTYPQTLALTDRLDYFSAHHNRHALCMCIEEALGLEVPERAQYIRTIMDELARIGSHLLFHAALCMDLGGLTAFFFGMRDREKILDIFEETTGGRLIQNYYCIGGVSKELHPTFVKKVKEFLTYLPNALKEYHDIFTNNVIAQGRLKNIGVLSREDAISNGITGPSGRASGWACDVRKLAPYAAYNKVDFKEVIYHKGDSFARYMVRMDEILESLSIIGQLIDKIPEGELVAKTKAIIRLPEGTYFKSVEACRGEFGVYIESKGDKTPYRVKFRSPCLPLVAVVDLLATGGKIADLIAIGGTLDYIVPDIDR